MTSREARDVGGLGPVNAEDSPGVARPALQFGDGQRRGIAANEGIGWDGILDRAEDFAFGIEVLENAFDDQGAAGERGEVIGDGWEPEPETPDLAAWREARLMLCARELLEACKYSLTLLGQISSEQFIAGGDRPAREQLLAAIEHASEGSFDSLALMERCGEDVRMAILVNRSKML